MGEKDKGRTVDICSREASIGRKEECLISYKENTISSVHCKITIQQSTSAGAGGPSFEVWLEDCSVNGTFVNAQKVGKGKKVPLAQNDEIGILNKLVNNPPYAFIFQDFTKELTGGELSSLLGIPQRSCSRPGSCRISSNSIAEEGSIVGDSSSLPFAAAPATLSIYDSLQVLKCPDPKALSQLKGTLHRGQLDIGEFAEEGGTSALLDVIAEISNKPRMSWLDVEVLSGALDSLRELINSEEGASSLLEEDGSLDRLVGLLALTEVRVRSKALQILACFVVYTDKPLVEDALRRANRFGGERAGSQIVNILQAAEKETQTCVDALTLLNALLACTSHGRSLVNELDATGESMGEACDYGREG